jgi:beta-glucosidase
VIGPNADDRDVLQGNYNGTPSKDVTPLEGIKAKVSPRTRVLYALGCEINDKSKEGFAEAVAAAATATLDPVIAANTPHSIPKSSPMTGE